MFSKGMFFLGVLFVLQLLVIGFSINLSPLALGGSVLAALASFSLAVFGRKAASSAAEKPKAEPLPENAAEAQSPRKLSGREGTYMLVVSLFCGIRLFYYQLINHYASTPFQEICIFIMGIAFLFGGIILKLRQ